MSKRFQTFAEFYPYYLSEHINPTCRKLHFVGSAIVLLMPILALALHNLWWLLGMPLAGYSFAWVGHFFFEHNRPATFKYPLFSLMGDWLMFWQLLTGKISFTSRS
ncbi:MAG: DUF962 domain-containing protein [Betaproteobacteria bacterium]|nr:DUF962 domain-containing protein [Betaproteobacteria bacterium]